MVEKQKSYKLNWIGFAIVAWELVFWSIFLLVHYSLGWWSEQAVAGDDILQYQHPQFLYGLLILIPVVLIFVMNISWRNSVLKNNFANHLVATQFKSFSTLNTFLKFFFFRNGLAFLILALANPQFGTKKVQGEAKSIEIMVTLDISNSMKVLDMEGNQSRLESTKRGLVQMINQLHGDKIGIVVFAGSAYPQLALTNDYAAAKLFVNEIEPNMITNQGTNIPDAINLAVRSFSKSETSKVILVMTDGENHEGNLAQSIQEARQKGIIINAVGIGSDKGGPIPVNGGGCKKDEQGEIIISKMNPDLVKQVAQLGGGEYSIENSAFPNFKPMLENTRKLKRGLVNVENFTVNEQQGLFFVWLAIGCFIVSIMWSNSIWGFFDKMTRIK